MDQLHEDKQELFRLRFAAGLSYTSIAELVGRSGSAETHFDILVVQTTAGARNCGFRLLFISSLVKVTVSGARESVLGPWQVQWLPK
jgi:hypothetical protein